MGDVDRQHLDWLARSFGRADYQPLAAPDIEVVQRVGEIVEFTPGGTVFGEGERADAAFIIDEGMVEVSRGEGSSRRIMAHAGPGAVLGDMAMFSDTGHSADVRAIGYVTTYRLDRSRLLTELAVHPGILLRWLVAGIRRMEETQRRVVRLMHKPVLAQVADLLLEESERQAEVNLSQSTIGTLLGVSRQSVNEALARLREQGVVETGYRLIRVVDPDRLESMAYEV